MILSLCSVRALRPAALAVLLALSHSPVTARADALWLENGLLTRQAVDMLGLLRAADAYGLHPADYPLEATAEELDRLRSGQAPRELQTRLDTALSAAASRFIDHLRYGRVSAKQAGFDLPAADRKADVATALRQIAAAPDVIDAVASLEPRPAPYRRLKQALAAYRELAKQPELTRLPPLPSRSVRPGESYEGAPALRRLLLALGDLPPEDLDERAGAVLEPPLVQALQRFQNRHGLQVDGVFGPRTFAAATTPLAERVRQIELSLERWRWTASLERPDIVVNVPQFMLFALPRHAQTGAGVGAGVLEMPVIVGQSYSHTRTPVFIGAIRYVVFQPYWDVPHSIVRREILPRLYEDPAYLDRHDMEIVRGQTDNAAVQAPTPEAIEALAAGRLRLRQRPGPRNALGPVKFMLPNPYNVYLHATPEQALFGRSQRAFSHGCIRVSQPQDLALYVLRNNAAGDWNEETIEAALCGSTAQRVDLQTPVRVMIFYSTVAVSESRGVLFFADIYGHDAKLRALLETARRPAR